jgi:hypothetical protein
MNVDDQVIPALNQRGVGPNKGGPQEYENGYDEEENKDDAEPISGDKI